MDFTEQSNSPLILSADLTKDCLNIAINDDSLVESDEDFFVSIASTDARVIIHPDCTKTVSIQNNDCMYLLPVYLQ